MAVSAVKHKHWNEMVGLVLLVAGLLIILSLITYSAGDPSFSVAGSGATKNTIGLIGAYLADVLLRLFGVSAYLIPFLLFGYGAFLVCKGFGDEPIDQSHRIKVDPSFHHQ